MSAVQFFYDLGSPYAFLTSERIDEAFDTDVEVHWTPILLGGVFKATARSSWGETPLREDGMAEVERRAAALGMPPFIWPDEWPNNGLTAMRIAVWAHEQGAGRRFASAAFGEQFLNGRPLSEEANLRTAAQRATVDPDAALAAAGDPQIKQHLIDNTQMALDLGVIGVPTVAVDGQIFWGDDRLHEAVAAQAAA